MRKLLASLRLLPEELHEVLRYHDRRYHPLDVESEVSLARPMMAIIKEPGEYVGLGRTIIGERRKKPRKKQLTPA